jgi:hypothetical protein
MTENTYQSRTGSLLSDVAFLFLLIIAGTAGVVWLSTMTSQNFHALANKFSTTSLLIANLAGVALSFKMIKHIFSLEISKQAKTINSGVAILILVIAIPLGLSYLMQYTMDQLYPILQHFTGK